MWKRIYADSLPEKKKNFYLFGIPESSISSALPTKGKTITFSSSVRSEVQ